MRDDYTKRKEASQYKSGKVIGYVTRYALTNGIIECEATYCNEEYVTTNLPEGFSDSYHVGVDFYLTKKSAWERAKLMKKRKIISLKKQIETLENKNITIRNYRPQKK